MSAGRRYVIGGTDVTDAVRASVDQAPPLTAAQIDQLRGLFRESLPAVRSKRRTRPAVVSLPPMEAA
jgi:hypothetical protein